MTILQLIINSLRHYWRTNLAVLLGVIAGTAVIGGALVVGDSVRGSLQQMTLDRLGRIDYALNTHRFFREALADEIGKSIAADETFEAIAPALLMRGSLERESDGERLFASRMNVFGVDDRAWDLTEHGNTAVPTERAVVLNHRAASELQVKAGDEVTLWVELPATIPRDALLGEREEVSKELVLIVSAVLNEEMGAGRLDLNPNQQLPRNAFVSLDTLQSLLKLDEGGRRDPRPARVNTLFVSSQGTDAQAIEPAIAAAKQLNALVAKSLTLDDVHLRIDVNETPNYLSLESSQLFLEDEFAWAAEASADSMDAVASPVLVYLANQIANPKVTDETAKTGYSMYSVIAGIDFTNEPPFGPFETIAGSQDNPTDDGIVLTDWLAYDLKAKVGDLVKVDYMTVGSTGETTETVEFKVHSIVHIENTPAQDAGFTPQVPGFTDVRTVQELELPFLIRKKLLTDRDEEYWDANKATPKAYVSLKTAQSLWKSRYGRLTSVRVAIPADSTPDEAKAILESKVLSQIAPEHLGLTFAPIKASGLAAAVGANDFTQLFLAFSFFLILSAAILIGLLFRLGLERRVSSIGLLSAIGLGPKQVRRIFVGEGLIVVLVGGLLGMLAAIVYAALMIHGLKTWWVGAIGTRFLELYVSPASLLVGFAISGFVMLVVVWWAMRQFASLSPRDMLAGTTSQQLTAAEFTRQTGRVRMAAIVSAMIAVVLVIASVLGLVPASEAFSGFNWRTVAFFVVGISFLVASLCAFSAWLASDRSAAVRGSGLIGIGRLGWRNAARNRLRSVLTVGLIAFATFVIVAVAAGHRNPAVEQPAIDSGNGGFTFVAESSQPILFDLNSTAGRDKLGFQIDDDETAQEILSQTTVIPFHVKPGEDASCLNLYQTRLPTILGVNDKMVQRGGFKFADTRAEKPWELLTTPIDDKNMRVYPVIGDMNTLMYSLKKGIGDRIPVPAEGSAEYYLEVVGMLDGSVFQGVLLMSSDNFRTLYPDRAGDQYFLIQPPESEESARRVATLLETNLAPFGFDTERVADRLASFLAVQNTYLSTFQALGGLGLLLGTLGLATVMLRNVLERRSELALLRSVGFRNAGLSWLVLAENGLLLFWGLTSGAIAAFLAMGPHLLTTGADVPWATVGVILAGVVVVGTAAALFAVFEAVRTPIVSTLRGE
jgi:putative ABC transport system permease protein